MEKKDLDWGNLSFGYMPTDYSYVCNYHDGAWEEGGLTDEHTVTLSELTPNTYYCFRVKALYGSNSSNYSTYSYYNIINFKKK